MQAIGTGMHRAASRFALIAKETAVDGDLAKAIAGLARVTEQCVACHAAFRTHRLDVVFGRAAPIGGSS